MWSKHGWHRAEWQYKQNQMPKTVASHQNGRSPVAFQVWVLVGLLRIWMICCSIRVGATHPKALFQTKMADFMFSFSAVDDFSGSTGLPNFSLLRKTCFRYNFFFFWFKSTGAPARQNVGFKVNVPTSSCLFGHGLMRFFFFVGLLRMDTPSEFHVA